MDKEHYIEDTDSQTTAPPKVEENDFVDEAKDREKLLASFVSDDEERMDNPIHGAEAIRTIIKEIEIDGQWFKRQLGVIVFILIGVILYITNRYQAQQEMIEEVRLQNELKDWKFRCMTHTSELTLRTRQSQVEEQLKSYGDSTLTSSPLPPYSLNEE